MTSPRRVIRTAALLVTFLGASCTTILGIDKDYREGTPPDGGLPCSLAMQCDDMNACTADSCDDGRCTHEGVPDGDAPTQVKGDCHVLKCEQGAERSTVDLTDIASDNNDCTFDTCDNKAKPAHTAAPAGTACMIAGQAGQCDMFATCKIACGPGKPDCDDKNPCTSDACNAGTSHCDFTPLDAVPTPGVIQAPGDCHFRQCVSGMDTDTVDDTDLPATNNDCASPTCTMGAPSLPNASAGQGCSMNGGKVCDGNGACVLCNVDMDCAGTTEDCQHPACTNHLCGQANTPVNTPVSPGLQTPGDCHVVVCDGAGSTKLNVDDADAKDDGNDCTDDICTSGVLSHPPKAINTPCGAGGTLVCNGSGACVGCVDDTKCNAPQTCGGCGVPMVCACCPKTCVDLGAACGIAADTCGGMIQCNDGMQDNGETDVDCGGPSCSVKCAQGRKCAANSDCAVSFCVDGVCCNSPCNGACQSCLAANKVSGADGTCGNVKGGVDPRGDCSDQGQASCGTDGQCDGAGACRYYATGSICVAASCANATTLNKADTCTAAHTCMDNGTQGCGNYACDSSANPDACKTSCAGDADCASPFYCGGSICVAKKVNGASCGGPSQCQSGNCVDGVCCSSASCPTCQSCAAGGTCTNIALGQPDNNPPGACTTQCDGNGTCL